MPKTVAKRERLIRKTFRIPESINAMLTNAAQEQDRKETAIVVIALRQLFTKKCG